jgi:hypothetical protein
MFLHYVILVNGCFCDINIALDTELCVFHVCVLFIIFNPYLTNAPDWGIQLHYVAIIPKREHVKVTNTFIHVYMKCI